MIDVRSLFETEFTSSSLDLQGYSFNEAGKKKVAKTKFRNKIDFDVDYDLITDIMANKGKFYFFKHNKKIIAVYPIRRDGGTYTMAERFFSQDVAENIRTELDRKMTFFTAYLATTVKDGKAIVDGTELPALGVKSGPFNWPMALLFGIIYGNIFRISMSSWAGFGVGFIMGIGIGSCFTKRTYYFKTDKEDTASGDDDTDEMDPSDITD